MSRGTGYRQKLILWALDNAFFDGSGAIPFSDIRKRLLSGWKAPEGSKLIPHVERSLRRGLAGLLKSGEVVAFNSGGPSDAHRYARREAFLNTAMQRWPDLGDHVLSVLDMFTPEKIGPWEGVLLPKGFIDYVDKMTDDERKRS